MSAPATLLSNRTALEDGDTSVTEVIKESHRAADTWEPHLNALLERFQETSLTKAAAYDGAGPEPDRPLWGLPIIVKDLISTAEGYTSAASRMLERVSLPYNATVVERLLAAGAIIVGKANLDEFAMGSSNEYSAFGAVKNPWDVERVPGGSSGGSAAAVASGEALAALGTDTGGSIRLPASYCNVVGLKPTYGRVSRFGVIAYASSFDQVGPFTRTVKDNALMMEVLAGVDPADATSSHEPVGNYQQACAKGIAGLTIGVPHEFMSDDVEPSVRAVIEAALTDIQAQGATIKPISLSLMAAAVPTYYVLVKAEASSNLARFDGLRYGRGAKETSANLHDHYLAARGTLFGSEVKRSIIMGTYVLSAGYADAWYKQACRVRTLIRKEMIDVFQEVDVIAGPVAPEAAFPLSSKTDDPLKMYLVDLFTDIAAVAGLPAMSVPAGFTFPPDKGGAGGSLPVGLQLIAPAFREDLLFQVGYAYEQIHEWWKTTPQVPTTKNQGKSKFQN